MYLEYIGLYLLLFIVHDSYQISTKASPNYIAAVVEIAPYRNRDSGTATLAHNAATYVKHIKAASQQHADIIVFPEDCLTSAFMPQKPQMSTWSTLIPSPSDNYVPCTQDTIKVDKSLKMLSCAARENKMYVVINIAERYVPQHCQKRRCGVDETLYYNCNVVFDRTGKVIARYRKYNLFGEKQFSVTKVPEAVTFETDFGVKFGIFICFDLLAKEPALTLSRSLGVTDFVYSTAWFSELPFLTAVQAQFGWAYAENVNLLTAGYSRPLSAHSGTGIFLGRKGTAKAVLSQVEHDFLLVASVPKMKKNLPENNIPPPSINGAFLHSSVAGPKSKDLFDSLWHEDISKFKTITVKGSFANTVCHNGFCCKFNVRANGMNNSPITYRLTVFDGTRWFGKILEASIRLCGVVQCANNAITSCGSNIDTDITFDHIEIEGTFDNYKNSLVMPSVADTKLLPFGSWTSKRRVDKDKLNVVLSLTSPTKNLATFGIYSREFNRDPKPKL